MPYPWVFEGGREPRRIIATLEAFAALLAIKFSPIRAHREAKTTVEVAPTFTDNKGNGSLLNKLMSVKFPPLSGPHGAGGAHEAPGEEG